MNRSIAIYHWNRGILRIRRLYLARARLFGYLFELLAEHIHVSRVKVAT